MSMMEQLVKELGSGRTVEVNALAARLDTSPEVVAAMLEHLQRSGLISAYFQCEDGCSGCSLSQSCTPKNSRAVRLWQNTQVERQGNQ
jgi:hypothetical protein